MPFSENQLSTWANQGATTSSAKTYNSINTCIDGGGWKSDIDFDTYLQGSYRNSTNIRGNSDVDVVIEFKSTFYSNKHELPAEQLREFEETHEDAKYSLNDFKSAVIKQLQNYYGSANIKVGNRSVKVLGKNGRLDADVICCAEYREYTSFSKQNQRNYASGIIFWESRTGSKVINFPKLHYDNGVYKNQNSSGNYKSTIRIIKNMSSRMIDNNVISEDLAPSYFIECLLFNLPNANYGHSSSHDNIVSILNTLCATSSESLQNFVCQNQQRYLFGNSEQQWNMVDLSEFLSQLIGFWNEG